jgi:hypothetical protein
MRTMTSDLSDASREELEDERDKLIAKYIGEFDKGVWYFERLKYIDKLIEDKS